MSKVNLLGEGWTYGAEHELADWSGDLPAGYARADDWTIVNSNGVAAQPSVKVYPFGGEVNTPPTDTTGGQVDCLKLIRKKFPNATVNHRSNLHVHVRVPGLKDSLPLLKRVQTYIHRELPKVIDLIEPLPVPTSAAGRKRRRRNRVSHRTFLTERRLSHQLEAMTVTDFFQREVPMSKKKQVMWHAQPRCCVNLRQLLQTDTVEFRHFPGTLDPAELETCLEWCGDFLQAALGGWDIGQLHEQYDREIGRHNIAPFPTFPTFDEEREVRYQATAAHGTLSANRIAANIERIINGKFSARYCPEEYVEARRKAGCDG